MPWTELNRLLADVTAGFAAAASSRAPVTNLVDRGVSFVCEASHAGEWPPPSQSQRAALLRGLAELGARLAELRTPLKAALASPGARALLALPVREGRLTLSAGPALIQLKCAAAVVASAASVATALDATASETRQLAEGAFTLLLSCGRVQAARAAADVERSRTSTPRFSAEQRWTLVASAVDDVCRSVRRLLCLAEQQEEAGQPPPLAPPKQLLRWLKALLALPPEAFAAGKYCNALGYGECSVPAAQSKLHRRACCWLPI